MEDLVQALGVDRTYAGRLLRLTGLAPNNIEAILQGHEPDGITLGKLRRNLPVCLKQRREIWATKQSRKPR